VLRPASRRTRPSARGARAPLKNMCCPAPMDLGAGAILTAFLTHTSKSMTVGMLIAEKARQENQIDEATVSSCCRGLLIVPS